MFKKLCIFTGSFLLFFVLTSSLAFASTLSLSPQTSTVAQGSTITVTVRLNTNGESVNGVSAYLSYPSDKLTVSYISYSSSAFAIEAEKSYGGGSIRISRGSISGVVSNSANVATIGMVGKSIGTATVAFIGGSAAPKTSDSSDSLNLGGSSGATYTIGAPLKVSITPTSTDSTKPVIKNIKVTDISTNSATVTWETDEPSDTTLEYGLTPDKYFLTIFDKTLSATHSATLQGEALTPGAVFHFRLKSKDKTGNEGVSKDLNLQLTGHNILILALDTKGNPIKDSQVLLYSDSQKGRTNTAGEVSFTNVTEGKHLVVLKSGFIEKTGEIDVTESFDVQSFTLNMDLTSAKSFFTNPYVLFSAVLAMIGFLTILLIVIFVRRRKNNMPQNNPPQNNPPQVPPIPIQNNVNSTNI